jgi:hypothetical protein
MRTFVLLLLLASSALAGEPIRNPGFWRGWNWDSQSGQRVPPNGGVSAAPPAPAAGFPIIILPPYTVITLPDGTTYIQGAPGWYNGQVITIPQ